MTSSELRRLIEPYAMDEIDLESDGSIAFVSHDYEGERRAVVAVAHHADALVTLFEACTKYVEQLPPDVLVALSRVMAVGR